MFRRKQKVEEKVDTSKWVKIEVPIESPPDAVKHPEPIVLEDEQLKKYNTVFSHFTDTDLLIPTKEKKIIVTMR